MLVFLATCGLAVAQSSNADSSYQQLRNIGLGSDAVAVKNVTLKRDAATFQLNSGTVCFLPPVNGKVTGAVFNGEGRLLLTPPLPSEERSLSLLSREKEFSETFTQLVLRFTDGTFAEMKKAGQPGSPSCDAGLLHNSQHATRKKLHYNLDARILQDVLSPEAGGLFVAFVHGKKYSDKIMFMIDPHGARWVQPEEIELMTYDENKEGIWTAFHYSAEYANGTAKGSQKNGAAYAGHQQLDTEIGKMGHLNGKATTELVARTPGVRVVPFMLFPTLRVQSVTDQSGQALSFVQEDKLEDPQFWVVLGKPLAAGEKYTITTTYGGKDAVTVEGTGNYFPVAREDWYPNPANGMLGDYTSYDMTFRIPKGMKMAATGDPVSDKNEGDHNVSVWKSAVPLTVAGFNFGKFKQEQAKLDKPDMLVLSYANEEPPDWVRNLQSSLDDGSTGLSMLNAPHRESDVGSSLGNMNTVQLNKKALGEGEISVRIYSDFFGPVPYKRLAITQQTATNFGQSWPGLVYLPMTYLFDTTTRHSLGNIMRTRYPTYTDDPYGYFSVVAPHEVAHQWWGHAVGFNSYRDQWMSEGFADTSASIFLQVTQPKGDTFREFWREQQKLLIEKNSMGFRPIDVGPVTMGFRLSSDKTGWYIYQNLVYPKGAYILYMIRVMMWSPRDGDERFKETMHDLVSTYRLRPATTEDFKAIVEKHMTPGMDLQGNHRLDWFFDEYVYGTELPAYHFESQIGQNGSAPTIHLKLTQSGVSPGFRMQVPIYFELTDGRVLRWVVATIQGNTTIENTIPLPQTPSPVKRAIINYNYDVLCTEN